MTTTKQETIQVMTTEELGDDREFYSRIRSLVPKNAQTYIKKQTSLKEKLMDVYRMLKDQTRWLEDVRKSEPRYVESTDKAIIKATLVGIAVDDWHHAAGWVDRCIPTNLNDQLKVKAGQRGGMVTMSRRKQREASRTGGERATGEMKARGQSAAHETVLNKKGEVPIQIGDPQFAHEVEEGPAAKSRADLCTLYIKIDIELEQKILEAKRLRVNALKISGRSGYLADEIEIERAPVVKL